MHRIVFLVLLCLVLASNDAKGKKLGTTKKDVTKDVSFYLWTRYNPVDKTTLKLDETILPSLAHSQFNPNNPIKILVHGYTGFGDMGWIQQTRDEFLKKDDVNVISVDWQTLAGPSPFYFAAVKNAKLVSEVVRNFMELLMDTFDTVTLPSFHVIGFSLGGQLVGLLGHQFDGQLDRITSLDPAGFMFHNVSDGERVSRSSAKFVDVIHTAGLWVGTDELVGHIDFYPNGGVAHQAGCADEDITLPCSHQRATDFFAESINSNVGFKAVLCDSWASFQGGQCEGNPTALMGLPATEEATEGAYFLSTNDQSPFAMAG